MYSLGMTVTRSESSQARARKYQAPTKQQTIELSELLARVKRPDIDSKQLDILRRGQTTTARDVNIYFAGDLDILNAPCVSIVGTRDVSDEGRERARWVSGLLAEAGVTILSGLAKGVDTAAHTAALEVGGHTAAVIGTPLSKAYPAENAGLQEVLYKEQLLLSPFGSDDRVFKSNFPARNRVMAALSDATVIIEASDTSGTLHQAAECARRDRWLFIPKKLAEDTSIHWPAKFLKTYKRAVVLMRVSDIMDRISPR
jgi:DNA processing protein